MSYLHFDPTFPKLTDLSTKEFWEFKGMDILCYEDCHESWAQLAQYLGATLHKIPWGYIIKFNDMSIDIYNRYFGFMDSLSRIAGLHHRPLIAWQTYKEVFICHNVIGTFDYTLCSDLILQSPRKLLSTWNSKDELSDIDNLFIILDKLRTDGESGNFFEYARALSETCDFLRKVVVKFMQDHCRSFQDSDRFSRKYLKSWETCNLFDLSILYKDHLIVKPAQLHYLEHYLKDLQSYAVKHQTPVEVYTQLRGMRNSYTHDIYIDFKELIKEFDAFSMENHKDICNTFRSYIHTLTAIFLENLVELYTNKTLFELFVLSGNNDPRIAEFVRANLGLVWITYPPELRKSYVDKYWLPMV